MPCIVSSPIARMRCEFQDAHSPVDGHARKRRRVTPSKDTDPAEYPAVDASFDNVHSLVDGLTRKRRLSIPPRDQIRAFHRALAVYQELLARFDEEHSPDHGQSRKRRTITPSEDDARNRGLTDH
ncbi:hypothetical protein CCMA1212_010670 [Trichoderma ghanense]|uniref:Uncharacterized protein n=1 Tax=Trichoderma ghanense TaxID=65468 RepID=A0ABY2GQQ2_9HYPO